MYIIKFVKILVRNIDPNKNSKDSQVENFEFRLNHICFNLTNQFLN